MQTARKTSRPPLNGVNTPNLLATIDLVASEPELGEFQFRAHSEWIEGAHARTAFVGFSGAGAELKHAKRHLADSDHPEILCGEDFAPTPLEWILHGLAGCLIAGVANIAAARGIRLTKVACSVAGDVDLRGILGISDKVRNGFRHITVTFDIAGDAPREKIETLIERSRACSAVFDVLTRGVPVAIQIRTDH